MKKKRKLVLCNNCKYIKKDSWLALDKCLHPKNVFVTTFQSGRKGPQSYEWSPRCDTVNHGNTCRLREEAEDSWIYKMWVRVVKACRRSARGRKKGNRR